MESMIMYRSHGSITMKSPLLPGSIKMPMIQRLQMPDSADGDEMLIHNSGRVLA